MPRAKLPVIWSPEAEQDLLDIWSYLAREASPVVADDQLRAIDRACETLAEWPFSGRARDDLFPGMRSVPVPPHVIFYRAAENEIQIVRVVHGHRDIETIFSA